MSAPESKKRDRKGNYTSLGFLPATAERFRERRQLEDSDPVLNESQRRVYADDFMNLVLDMYDALRAQEGK